MGTAKEWREVLVSGALWGSLMMLWQVFGLRSGGKVPALYFTLLTWAIAGFSYGLLVTFEFRAFRWPLITITVPLVIAFVLVPIIHRKKMKGSQSNSPAISR